MTFDLTATAGRVRTAAGARMGIVAALGLGLLGALGGCATDPEPFATPEAAVDSLIVALRASDEPTLEKILGSDARDVLSSGDDVADRNRRADFLRMYDEKHTLARTDDDAATLEVGDTNWPLPIPVVKGDKGWYFDTAAGLDEMLSRRIGRNELDAIQTCLAIADAQREYASKDYNGDGWREYARSFASDPGKKNGLFWPAKEGEIESPLGPLVANAAEEGYRRSSGERTPYHGYYYRILTRQGPDAPGGSIDFVAQDRMIGGFGVIAWPAEYGNSGIKSFIVSHHGVVYERDLGDGTERTASSMAEFNPGPGWTPCATQAE